MEGRLSGKKLVLTDDITIREGEVVRASEAALKGAIHHWLKETFDNVEDHVEHVRQLPDLLKKLALEVYVITKIDVPWYKKVFYKGTITVKCTIFTTEEITMSYLDFLKTFQHTGMTYESYNVLYNN